MIKQIAILGAGSAGLLAALSIKKHLPQLRVRMVRSQQIGVIGVGESTTAAFPRHLFDYLGLSPRRFYELARPTWKMGIHFIWGPNKGFEYGFGEAMDVKFDNLSLPNGFYCFDDFNDVSVNVALMARGKAFPRDPKTGAPFIPPWHAFHLFNPSLVACLEQFAIEAGIEIIDGKLASVQRGPAGLSALVLEDGRTIEADFFVDASGFRSELLGRELAEPFVSFDRSLFNDRAVVGSWTRTDEPIDPYTTAETMNAGWCWRIDHEDRINRGYVYSSRFLSDDEARSEFLAKNPKATTWDHVVKFRSGRYRRAWVQNVVAIGNACGFVEPLEATALMVACGQCQNIVACLSQGQLDPSPSMTDLYNQLAAVQWDEVRDFLSIHFRYNTRLDTPYWNCCRNEADVSGCQALLDFYRDNGPVGLCRHCISTFTGIPSQFGLEGYLVLLLGQGVPHRLTAQAPQAERSIWERHRNDFRMQAQNGLTVAEALQFIRHPRWRWAGETA